MPHRVSGGQCETALLAVSTLTRAGNQVSFGQKGGRIYNPRTKRTIDFVRREGIYLLEILVAPPRRDGPPGEPGWTTVGGRNAGGSKAQSAATRRPGQPDSPGQPVRSLGGLAGPPTSPTVGEQCTSGCTGKPCCPPPAAQGKTSFCSAWGFARQGWRSSSTRKTHKVGRA